MPWYSVRIGLTDRTYLLLSIALAYFKALCHLSIICLVFTSCYVDKAKGTFGYDFAFLSDRMDVHLLKAEDSNGQILLAPDYQGRVMTSTARGLEGRSYGWINHDLIASGETQPKINAVGGEDRFWLGSEMYCSNQQPYVRNGRNQEPNLSAS